MNKLYDFSLLKDVSSPLYTTVHDLVYWKLLLPAFLLAIVLTYFKLPQGQGSFLDCVKKLVITVLILVAFPDICDAIINISNYISEAIAGDRAHFLSEFFSNGLKASRQNLKGGGLLNYSNLLISGLSFICWCIVYVAAYLIIAMRHFMWTVLTGIAPLLILCNLFPGTSNVTRGLFKSLIELSAWQIYWRILEQILHKMSYANLAGPDDLLMTMALNIVVAYCMINTPKIIKSVIDGGLPSMEGLIKSGAKAGATILATKGMAIPAKVSSFAQGVSNAGKGSLGLAQRISNYTKPRLSEDSHSGGGKLIHTLGSRTVEAMGIKRSPVTQNPKKSKEKDKE